MHNKKSKVSVCLPTFGRAYLLPFVIQSVLSQTYTDFELLISDDASPDNTEDVVKSFKDSRIRYHKNHSNLGVRKNWDFIIKNARNEYVFKLDDDDYIAPEFLARVVSIFDKYSNVGSVYTGFFYAKNYNGEFFERVVDNTFFKSDYAKGIDYLTAYLLHTSVPGLHPSSAVFRYSLAEKIGFYEKIKNDLMFSLALASMADVGYIHKPLFYYVQHTYARASYEKKIDPKFLNFEPTKIIEDFFDLDFIKGNTELIKLKHDALKRERITKSIIHLVMCRKNFKFAYFIGITENLIKKDKKLLLSPLFMISLFGSIVLPKKLVENLSYMYKSRRIISWLVGKLFKKNTLNF